LVSQKMVYGSYDLQWYIGRSVTSLQRRFQHFSRQRFHAPWTS
jgi:hypothetical protein